MFDAIWSVVGPVLGVLGIISFVSLIGGFGFLVFYIYRTSFPSYWESKDKKRSCGIDRK